MKKLIKILFVVLGIVLFLVLINLAYTYVRIQRGDLVKWDNKWYTQEQLQEKFPPQEYDAPAKNTPEDTYVAFRQALLNDDIERALEQITDEKREKYREIFEDINILNKYKEMPEKSDIKKMESETYGNFTSYYFKTEIDGKQLNYTIQFIKDSKGVWKIDVI